MTQTPEQVTGDRAAEYAHILDDLHQVQSAMAEIRDAVARIEKTTDELAPAARAAAAMLNTPVTAYLAARKEANGGERLQRAGEAEPRRRRSRVARRKLPDA